MEPGNKANIIVLSDTRTRPIITSLMSSGLPVKSQPKKKKKKPRKKSVRGRGGDEEWRPGGESSSEEEWQPWMEERPKRRTGRGECGWMCLRVCTCACVACVCGYECGCACVSARVWESVCVGVYVQVNI